MTIGKLIGSGRVAEVYAWGEHEALKLFFAGYSGDAVEQEAAIARIVHALGIPTPAVKDVITFKNRHGIVFERVDGPSMLAEMSSKPWKLFHLAGLLADLQFAMGSQTVSGLTSQRLRLQRSISTASPLPIETQHAALRTVEELAKGSAVCHGDFHPGNIVMSRNGAMIIDWTTATSGEPLIDVAQTSLLLQLGRLPPGTPLITHALVTVGRKLFHMVYMRRYLRLRPASQQVIAKARLPAAVARLAAGIPGERTKLLEIILSVPDPG